MPRNFYYGKDADIVTGSANFAARVETDFADYFLTSAQAAAFVALNTVLQTVYPIAIEPSTRTPVAIENKNQAIKNMRTNAISLNGVLRANPNVTDAMLVTLGLLPRTIPTPRPVPAEAPVVEVLNVNGRTVKIRVHAAGSDRRGLPFGATSAYIYSFVGPEAPSDPREYHFEGSLTKGMGEILFPNSVASGALVWLSACWVSQRGQRSVGSVPISFTLQGGAIPAAA